GRPWGWGRRRWARRWPRGGSWPGAGGVGLGAGLGRGRGGAGAGAGPGRLPLAGVAEFGLQRQREDRSALASLVLRCELYWSWLSPRARPSPRPAPSPPSPPRSSHPASAAAFGELFAAFGTHLVVGARAGGLLRSVTAVRLCRAAMAGASAQEVADCLRVEVTAGGGGAARAGAAAAACRRAREAQGQQESFSEAYSERLVEVEGGRQDGDLLYGPPGAYRRWLQSLPGAPGLVAAEVRSLHTLLPEGSARRRALKAALGHYIAAHGLRLNCSRSCPAGTFSAGPCRCLCAAPTGDASRSAYGSGGRGFGSAFGSGGNGSAGGGFGTGGDGFETATDGSGSASGAGGGGGFGTGTDGSASGTGGSGSGGCGGGFGSASGTGTSGRSGTGGGSTTDGSGAGAGGFGFGGSGTGHGGFGSPSGSGSGTSGLGTGSESFGSGTDGSAAGPGGSGTGPGGVPLPARGDPLPARGAPVPARGDPLPARGAPVPARGAPLAAPAARAAPPSPRTAAPGTGGPPSCRCWCGEGRGWWGDHLSATDAYVRVAFGEHGPAPTPSGTTTGPAGGGARLDLGVVRLPSDPAQAQLRVEVWDQDQGWDDDLLGACQVPLQATGGGPRGDDPRGDDPRAGAPRAAWFASRVGGGWSSATC
ncbi:spidroin-1-like, partial [Melanerpes formicivorus]|uniref:spidroin-1-like n=1 Tax=Melanerpes formicivorus TaxID=211600 RepID=UPI00358F125D